MHTPGYSSSVEARSADDRRQPRHQIHLYRSHHHKFLRKNNTLLDRSARMSKWLRHRRGGQCQKQQIVGNVPRHRLPPSSTDHLNVRLDTVGQDAQRLIGELAEANIDPCGDTNDNVVREVAPGREMASNRSRLAYRLNVALLSSHQTSPSPARASLPCPNRRDGNEGRGAGHGSRAAGCGMKR